MDDTLIDWSGLKLGWEELNRPLVANIYTFLEQLGHTLPDPDEFHSAFQRRSSEAWNQATENWSGPDFAEVLRRVCADAGLDPGGLDIDALMRAYGWQPMPGVVLYPDTVAVLQALREAGYALGLVTNSYFPMWMRDVELEHYQLLDFFNVRITACDAGHLKPHRAILTRRWSIWTNLSGPSSSATEGMTSAERTTQADQRAPRPAAPGARPGRRRT